MLAHITGLKALASELAVTGAPVSNKDVVLTLLCSLPESYQPLIISLESRAEELTLQFVTQRLLHEEMKRLENAGSDSSSSHALVVSQKQQALGPRGSHDGGRQAQYGQQQQRLPSFPHSDPRKVMRKGRCNFCNAQGHWAASVRRSLQIEERWTIVRTIKPSRLRRAQP